AASCPTLPLRHCGSARFGPWRSGETRSEDWSRSVACHLSAGPRTLRSPHGDRPSLLLLRPEVQSSFPRWKSEVQSSFPRWKSEVQPSLPQWKSEVQPSWPQLQSEVHSLLPRLQYGARTSLPEAQPSLLVVHYPSTSALLYSA